jgi:hypothetical protein
MSRDDDAVYRALSEELERLTWNAAFTIAEFDVNKAAIFEVYRDEHGTPQAASWTYGYENGALQVEDGEADRWSKAMADPDSFYRHVAPKFIVRTPRQLPSGLSDLLPDPPEVQVYECLTSLSELLRAAIRASPLLLGYELAVLKRVPAGRAGAPQFVLTGHPLFSPGETQGFPVQVPVKCAPTDAEGTAFAVVTREPRPDLPWHARPLRPLQVQAAVGVPPGNYVLTAVLMRPGQVRFQGLPVPLGSCGRSWEELERLVPRQVTEQVPVHLVCLIEVCGGDDRLQQRIYWLEKLITNAQTGAAPLLVSVVAYGAHGVAWRVDDRPPEIRAWAVSSGQAINALRGLAVRRADDREYQGAAQLECALRLVRGRLAPADGRPVIVTAGGRPAHPHELDTVNRIIPCPDWVNGMSELGQLLSLPGIAFGALRDPRWRGGLWEQLGRHAAATVGDAVDVEGFATSLGLRVAAQTVPFPVIE